jgi:O-antigen ligase
VLLTWNVAERVGTVLLLFILSGALISLVVRGGVDPGEAPLVTIPRPLELLGRIGRRFTLGFVLVQVLIRPRQLIRPLLRSPFLLAVIGLAFVSVLWSSESLPNHLRMTYPLVVTTLVGTFLISRYRPQELVELLAITYGIVVFLSLAVVFLYPQLGTAQGALSDQWRGVFTHKNSLGHSMLLAILAFGLIVWQGHRWRWLAWIGLGLSALLLIKSGSITPVVVLAVVLVGVPLAAMVYRSRRKGAVILLILCTGMGAALFGLSQREVALTALGKDTSLSGRIPLWVSVWDQIQERPWLGYGYRAFWQPLAGPEEPEGAQVNEVQAAAGWPAEAAHNGFLEVWLDLGLVGLVCFLIALASAMARIWRRLLANPDLGNLWFFGFLLAQVLRNVTESSFLANSLTWALFVAAAGIPAGLVANQSRARGDRTG